MSKIVVLGSACAVADRYHANAQLAVVSSDSTVLVDCAGAPSLRLEEAGIDLETIDDLILTHFHPDHVAGTPLLLMDMWLTGRQKPLRIYGLHHCLERLESMMAFYHWDNWPGFFTVAFHRLPERERVMVLENSEIRVYSSPVNHIIPTIGLRIEDRATKRVASYSCDTEPSEAVVNLAHEADYLIHEATGEGPGHSSPSQAGEIATKANARELLLIHYPVRGFDTSTWVPQAKSTFSGKVRLAQDLMEIEL